MNTIDQFRAFVQAKMAIIRVKMTQRDGESVGDALERTDALYGEQEATRAVGYLLDNALDMDELQRTVAAALPEAKGLELDELQMAQRLIDEFENLKKA